MDPKEPIPSTDDTPTPLEEQYDLIAQLVTAHGPRHLIRGMKALEANQAIVECIQRLLVKVRVLSGKIEKLRFESNDHRNASLRRSQELNRLANYVLVDWQDHIGRGQDGNGESSVDVAIRLLKAYKEIKDGTC